MGQSTFFTNDGTEMTTKTIDVRTGEVRVDPRPAPSFPSPPKSPAEIEAELDQIDDRMRAIIRWVAQKHGMTMQDAIAELRPIYRAIRS